ncbi:MAG: CCA tRNA nucleotidyltransferase [Magnetococcales bacterium]|nr:CCA tRNA nucleotidyltransferase [Magnetococcales bacterium]
MYLSLQRSLSPFVHSLLDDLDRLIGPIFLVGDALRDALRNKPPPDELTLLTSHPLPHCLRKIQDAGYAAAVMSNKHNSLLLPLKRKENPRMVEIATFRHRPSHPATVAEDLFHRDITANAMAFRWPDGPLIDPYNGREDLDNNVIRLVNGAQTLREDPLRALRFFRFTLQLAGKPDPLDLKSSEETHPGQVAQDQVRAEFDQIFTLPLRDRFSQEMVHRLFQSVLGQELLPEFALLRACPESTGQKQSAWENSLRMLLNMTAPTEEEEVSFLDLRWAALLHETGKGVCGIRDAHGALLDYPGLHEETMRINAALLARLQFSKRRQRRINHLVQNLEMSHPPTDRALRRLIEQAVPVEGLFRLLRAKREAMPDPSSEETLKTAEEFARCMRRCNTTREAMLRLRPVDLALTGGEILDMVRLPPGPWLGRLRQTLVGWVGQDPNRNQRELLATQVREWICREEGKM